MTPYAVNENLASGGGANSCPSCVPHRGQCIDLFIVFLAPRGAGRALLRIDLSVGRLVEADFGVGDDDRDSAWQLVVPPRCVDESRPTACEGG